MAINPDALLRYAARPCRTCPWRLTVALKPGREVDLVLADAVAGEPFTCTGGSVDDDGVLCAPWLTTVGKGNEHIQRAVAERRLPLDVLSPKRHWPNLHPSVDAVLGAATVREQVGKVDPLMVELRRVREGLGWSQPRAALAVGIMAATLRDDERGRVSPPLSRLRAYADAYGVDLAVTRKGPAGGGA